MLRGVRHGVAAAAHYRRTVRVRRRRGDLLGTLTREDGSTATDEVSLQLVFEDGRYLIAGES